MPRIFTYGTLRSKGSLHNSYFKPGTETTLACITGSLYEHTCGAFPVARHHDGGIIWGEVIDTDQETLDAILAMEADASYVPIQLEVPGHGACWFCSWPDDQPTGPRVPDGDWLEYDAVRREVLR